MTGSYFRGDAVPVLSPEDELRFATVTYNYYEHLKALDPGYFFYNGPYVDYIASVLDPDQKTIVHIPNVNSRESTQRGKTTEVSEIMDALGTWEGTVPIPVMTSRSGRNPWRTRRWRPSSSMRWA